MAYVPVRTDQSKYSSIAGGGGEENSFGDTVTQTTDGFGVQRTIKGVVVTEILDALPMGRQETLNAVNNGSAILATHPGLIAAGFVAPTVVDALAPTITSSVLYTQLTTLDGVTTIANYTSDEAVTWTIDDLVNFTITAGSVATVGSLALGSYPFVVTATDASGNAASVAGTLTVV